MRTRRLALGGFGSERAARTGARAVVAGGGTAFTFLGLISAFENGRAFSRELYPDPVIAGSFTASPSVSLFDEFGATINEADQQPRPTGDRGLLSEAGRIFVLVPTEASSFQLDRNIILNSESYDNQSDPTYQW